MIEKISIETPTTLPIMDRKIIDFVKLGLEHHVRASNPAGFLGVSVDYIEWEVSRDVANDESSRIYGSGLSNKAAFIITITRNQNEILQGNERCAKAERRDADNCAA